MKMLVVVVVALLLAGCSSSTRGDVRFTASTARVPISLTRALADDNGIVAAGRIHRLDDFRYETDGCVNATLDISEAVNREVARVHGDAIVELEVQSKPSSDCVSVRLHGVIVRVDP